MPLRNFLNQLGIITNWPVLLAVAVLSSLGAISIWAEARLEGVKQLIYLAAAFAVLVLFQTINYRTIGRWVWAFYVGSLGLALYTVFGKFADKHHHPLPLVHNIKGVYAWINLKVGSQEISLEPSELVKISFVLVLARFLRYRSKHRTIPGLLQPFALAVVPVVFILKQPDLGVAALFMPVLLVMLFVAGAKVKHMLGVLALGLMLVPIFWLSGMDRPVFRHLPLLMEKYQRDRVYGLFSSDPGASTGSNYQQDGALKAFGSGGWFGKGPGNIPVGRRVPESHDDMIFALIGEQFGLLGALFVLGSFLVLFAAGIAIASATKEPFGRLIAVGLVAMLACQTTINLMVCLKMMPVTGVTLPFVSYGGSSLVASYMAAGLLLNVGQNRPIMIGREAFEFDEEE